jgi:DNA modification methylase
MDVVGDGPGELVHGFHSYPARFHPELPRRLFAGTPGARVLDPFVGSGTTLVEAALAGRAGLGVDANPLAVALSRLKATPLSDEKRALLAGAAASVAADSAERVRAARRASTPREPPRKATRYDDPRRYPPHVFRELVTLRERIDVLSDEWTRNALRLVLSSIVVKVSLQRSDTDETLVERNVPRGAATRHFAARAVELVARMADFAARVPPGTPAPEVHLGDARHLAKIPSETIDLVITSPPYLGTYDYTQHHARRFGWVGLDPKPLFDLEIGSRRGATVEGWRRDVSAFVREVARVLRSGGWGYFLVGDSAIGQVAIPGDTELRRAAEAARLSFVAMASQARPEPYAPTRGAGRNEHLVAFRRR